MKMYITNKWLVISFIIIIFLFLLIQKSFNHDSVENMQSLNEYVPTDTPVPTPTFTFTAAPTLNTPEPTEYIEELSYEKGIFSWAPQSINSDNRKTLYQVISALEITEVYQYFDEIDTNDQDAFTLATVLNVIDVDLYILAGGSDWTYRADGQPMLNEISRAIAFREVWGKDALKGIVFDIEPYDSQRWIRGKQEVLLENYISGMKAAYEAAQKEDIRIILCIPRWFDEQYNDTLLELIKYCDEISVMNYGRSGEYEHMENEIEYARRLDKDIACIFEFQAVGLHNLTDEQTYNNLGIDAAINSFENLYDKADYSNLKLAFHYLTPVSQLIQEDEQP